MEIWKELFNQSGNHGLVYFIGIGIIAICLAVKAVLELITNNPGLFSQQERDRRTSVRSKENHEHADTTRVESFRQFFLREEILLDRDLSIRYSQNHFRKFVKEKQERDQWDKPTGDKTKQKVYRLRGYSALWFSLITAGCIVPGILLLIAAMVVGLLDQDHGVYWPLFGIALGFLVVGVAILQFIRWEWDHSLVTYAYKRYVRLPLIEQTSQIFERTANPSTVTISVDYPTSYRMFEEEMIAMKGKQTLASNFAGYFVGGLMPTLFIGSAIDKLGFAALSQVILMLGIALFFVGIVLSVYVIQTITSIPPSCTIQRPKRYQDLIGADVTIRDSSDSPE